VPETPKPIGPHDLSGMPGGDIDRSSHDYTFWERGVVTQEELDDRMVELKGSTA
jgi:hypothetical protein